MKKLIREIHRRSVWQVLSIYVASSWAVLGIVDFFTDTAGLPDWTPTMALVVVLLGLPVVVATAAIQGGLRGRAQPWPADDEADAEAPGVEESTQQPTPGPSAGPSGRRYGLFTWRNALIGGMAAGGVFLVVVVGYVASWATGFGPVGNLVAQGVLDEGDPILLSDFENRSASTDLARTVTEALRVDLASSEVIRLIEPGQVDNILELMQAEDELPLRGDRAREVALRGGIKAVIEGTVGSAGEGFILAATIRATDTGETVASFRRTAGDAADVIEAIDGLSQDIRERAGESLRAIRAEAPAIILAAEGRIGEARAMLRQEIIKAREEEAYQRAFTFQETRALLELAFETGRAGDVIMDAFQNEFPSGGVVSVRKIPLLGALASTGHPAAGEEVLRALREEWAGTPGEFYAEAFTEAYDFLVAPIADPRATVTVLRRIAEQVDCPTCFGHEIAQALIEMGRPEEALPLYAVTADGVDPRRRPLLVRATLPRRTRVLEAMGDTAGAIAEYERLVGLLTDPDDEGQRYLDSVRAKIEALQDR